MTKKLAIIACGGGMTCSYSASVVCALAKEFKITDPDIVIASSGSSGTMAYFVAKQYQSIENIWKNLLWTKRFVNWYRFWKIMNIDYLIDEVFKKKDPLNTVNLSFSKINFLVSVTDDTTGKLKYFSNKNKVDFFEVLRASKALAWAYNRGVNINE